MLYYILLYIIFYYYYYYYQYYIYIYMCVCPHQNHKGLSVATLPIQLVLPRNIFKNPSVA